MKAILCAAALAVAAPASAQDAARVVTASEFQAMQDALIAEAGRGANHSATRYLRQAPNVAVLVVARTQTGEVEEHQLWTDEIVVRAGEIELVTGGTIVGRHPSGPPGEFRGSAIGGAATTRRLAPGDVVEIPAGMPHWVKVVGTTPTVTLVYKVR